MKAFQAAVIVGGLLAVAGLWIMIPSRSSEQSYSDSIGAQEYLYIPLDVFWGGYVSTSYAESSGRSLVLYVFTNDQFVSFTTQFSAPFLASTIGSSGSFSANFPAPGKYYLVIDHGPGNEQTTQAFSLTVSFGGTNTLVLALGSGMIIVGGIIAFLGYRAKKSAEGTRPPSPGVVLYDQQTPPEKPPTTPPAEYSFQPPPAQLRTAPPVGKSEKLRMELERAEEDLRRMDELRRTQNMANPDLFDKTYSKKVEEAEEIRRRLRSLEQP